EGLDRPATSLDHVLDNREPQAAPARSTGPIGAVETLEQTRKVFLRHADPVVADGQHPGAVVAPQAEDAGRALPGVTKSVLGEVLDDDPQHPRPQRQLQAFVFDLDLEADARPLRTLVELRDDLTQERRGLRRAERDDLTTGLQLAEEEDVVDQLVHQLDLRAHAFKSRVGIAARKARTLDQ